METIQSKARVAASIERRMFWRYAVGLAVLVAIAVGARWTMAAAWIGTGFFAQQLCSSVFLSGRAPDEVVASDLRVYWPAPLFRSIDWSVDRAAVTASWLGIVRREARYRDGLGCALSYPEGIALDRAAALGLPRRDTRGSAAAAAHGAKIVSQEAIAAVSGSADIRLWSAVDQAFDEPDPVHPRHTRAVVVMQAGRIAAERYAPGFSAETRFPGWSLTKSVVNALIGALAQEGRLHLSDRLPIDAWRDDPRGALTYDDLLRMSSGLQFNEAYDDPFSDVTRMLYDASDASEFAIMKPLVAAPGTVWAYASGTTNVLSRALSAFAHPDLPYHEMPRRLLFDRLGMASAVLETDQSGNLIGSSSMFATARDWARFGWLYAADGIWNGERILPPGWVAYSSTPAPADRHGRYGAHFWLFDAEERAHARAAASVEVPADAFFAAGFAGQRITIIPSRALVIVRLGHTVEADAFNNAGFAAQIVAALEPAAATDATMLAALHRY